MRYEEKIAILLISVGTMLRNVYFKLLTYGEPVSFSCGQYCDRRAKELDSGDIPQIALRFFLTCLHPNPRVKE